MKRSESIFSMPMWPPVMVAAVVTVAFYALLLNGFLEVALLKRYCLCHPAAYVTVGFFFTAIGSLSIKLWRVRSQARFTDQTAHVLAELLHSAPAQSRMEAARWLDALWKTQPTMVCQCWMGRRIGDIVQLHVTSGSSQHLDEGMRDLSKRDAEQLHASYGLVRIVLTAMPMIGFLGTVIGISDTLGQMNVELLAKGSVETLNGLRAGAFVALDTTAIALVLTVAALFFRYFVIGLEASVVSDIDGMTRDRLVGWLGQRQDVSDAQANQEFMGQLTSQLVATVSGIVEKQAELWKQTISDAHLHWQNLTGSAGDQIQQALAEAIDTSLDKHAKYLERVQSEGAAQIEGRWQQWQTSLSEQARAIHHQQREIVRQSELLVQLVNKSSDLERMDQVIASNLTRLTDVDRFHEAAVCLTEAVAMIGTQMERHGMLGKQSIRLGTQSISTVTPSNSKGRAA